MEGDKNSYKFQNCIFNKRYFCERPWMNEIVNATFEKDSEKDVRFIG